MKRFSVPTPCAYDQFGNKISETLPNGIVTTYSYDSLNRLTGETETNAAGTLVFSQAYTYNDNGLRASVVEQQLQPSGSYLDSTTLWTYDADGRLISEDYSINTPGGPPDGLPSTISIPAGYDLGYENGTATGAVSLTWDGSEYVSGTATEAHANSIANGNSPGVVLLPPGDANGNAPSGQWEIMTTGGPGMGSIDLTLFGVAFTPAGPPGGN